MAELIGSLGAWHYFFGVLLVYGFFPGLAARLISLCFSKGDPRRQELIAEVYAVPRWERPIWVAEQFERALCEGVWERVYDAADGRLFNRWQLMSGAQRNAEHPESFWIPSEEEIETLQVGDLVKLLFEAKGWTHDLGMSGERMWVKITAIKNASLIGELANQPIVWNHLNHGDKIRFQKHHIIDYDYSDEADDIAPSAA